ncbi:MAG TPA: hypothetical protein VNJ02_10855 [Vicinamibacterales bacterium]|nr:hypothetical protein [Vicinamibacterales bacterium]
MLIALALFNDRVREHLSIGSSDGFAVLGQVNDVALLIALVAAQAVREQSIEHVSLMAFSGAALVLVIFLLRV